MAGVSITPRPRKRSKKFPKGRAYQVRYRLGGRFAKLEDAGTFPNKAAAEKRQELIRMEIAGGRDPRIVLDQLEECGEVGSGLGAAMDGFIAAIAKKVAPGTLTIYANARARVVPIVGEETHPTSLLVADVQRAINTLDGELGPETLRNYIGKLATALDAALPDGHPNPARSKKLIYPTIVKKRIVVPATADVHAILAYARGLIGKARRSNALKIAVALEAIECFGLRCEDIALLEAGDIDRAEGQIHWHSKTDSGWRWIPAAPELLEAIVALIPEGAPASHRVFGGVSKNSLGRVITEACEKLGLDHTSPHKLRHRRISMWIRHGIDNVTVKNLAGHAKLSMQDVYGHVIVDPLSDQWRRYWLDWYAGAPAPAELAELG